MHAQQKFYHVFLICTMERCRPLMKTTCKLFHFPAKFWKCTKIARICNIFWKERVRFSYSRNVSSRVNNFVENC